MPNPDRLIRALEGLTPQQRKAVALGLRAALFSGPATVSFADRDLVSEYLGDAVEQAEARALDDNRAMGAHTSVDTPTPAAWVIDG